MYTQFFSEYIKREEKVVADKIIIKENLKSY